MENKEKYIKEALYFFDKAKIILRQDERDNLEITDLGLNDFYTTGLMLNTYVNTERCCAKEIVLLSRQTCPEHLHPKIGTYEGKEETFRCRFGKVFLYVEGKPTENIQAIIKEEDKIYYTVFNEIILNPGEQYTLKPNTKHWFQAGDDGAVISEFSTKSLDEFDIFTNPNIIR